MRLGIGGQAAGGRRGVTRTARLAVSHELQAAKPAPPRPRRRQLRYCMCATPLQMLSTSGTRTTASQHA
eukprot:7849267-Pyramimonas_sp.AAC.1